MMLKNEILYDPVVKILIMENRPIYITRTTVKTFKGNLYFIKIHNAAAHDNYLSIISYNYIYVYKSLKLVFNYMYSSSKSADIAYHLHLDSKNLVISSLFTKILIWSLNDFKLSKIHSKSICCVLEINGPHIYTIEKTDIKQLCKYEISNTLKTHSRIVDIDSYSMIVLNRIYLFSKSTISVFDNNLKFLFKFESKIQVFSKTGFFLADKKNIYKINEMENNSIKNNSIDYNTKSTSIDYNTKSNSIDYINEKDTDNNTESNSIDCFNEKNSTDYNTEINTDYINKNNIDNIIVPVLSLNNIIPRFISKSDEYFFVVSRNSYQIYKNDLEKEVKWPYPIYSGIFKYNDAQESQSSNYNEESTDYNEESTNYNEESTDYNTELINKEKELRSKEKELRSKNKELRSKEKELRSKDKESQVNEKYSHLNSEILKTNFLFTNKENLYRTLTNQNTTYKDFKYENIFISNNEIFIKRNNQLFHISTETGLEKEICNYDGILNCHSIGNILILIYKNKMTIIKNYKEDKYNENFDTKNFDNKNFDNENFDIKNFDRENYKEDKYGENYDTKNFDIEIYSFNQNLLIFKSEEKLWIIDFNKRTNLGSQKSINSIKNENSRIFNSKFYNQGISSKFYNQGISTDNEENHLKINENLICLGDMMKVFDNQILLDIQISGLYICNDLIILWREQSLFLYSLSRNKFIYLFILREEIKSITVIEDKLYLWTDQLAIYRISESLLLTKTIKIVDFYVLNSLVYVKTSDWYLLGKTGNLESLRMFIGKYDIAVLDVLKNKDRNGSFSLRLTCSDQEFIFEIISQGNFLCKDRLICHNLKNKYQIKDQGPRDLVSGRGQCIDFSMNEFLVVLKKYKSDDVYVDVYKKNKEETEDFNENKVEYFKENKVEDFDKEEIKDFNKRNLEYLHTTKIEKDKSVSGSICAIRDQVYILGNKITYYKIGQKKILFKRIIEASGSSICTNGRQIAVINEYVDIYTTNLDYLYSIYVNSFFSMFIGEYLLINSKFGMIYFYKGKACIEEFDISNLIVSMEVVHDRLVYLCIDGAVGLIKFQ